MAEQLKFLLINYSKTLGKYNRVIYPKQPEKEIRGNVLTPVPLSYIEEFNIPFYKDFSIVKTECQNHSRIYNDYGQKRVINVRGYERSITAQKGQIITLKKLKASSGHLVPEFEIYSYYFKFPYFFNLSMINQALSSILQNYTRVDRLYFFKNGKRHEIIDSVTGWGAATLGQNFIESKDHPSRKWGDICIIKH